jgi:hypothetical protein
MFWIFIYKLVVMRQAMTVLIERMAVGMYVESDQALNIELINDEHNDVRVDSDG